MGLSLETAMGLYGLTDFVMLWERTTETRFAVAQFTHMSCGTSAAIKRHPE